MVKKATAITKFTHPCIVYATHGICRTSFIMYAKSPRTIAFTIKTVSQKKNIKKGRVRIFKIGLIVTFINHSIIPHTRYVFQASKEKIEQFKHHKTTQAPKVPLLFGQRIKARKRRMSALIQIEIIIFIRA